MKETKIILHTTRQELTITQAKELFDELSNVFEHKKQSPTVVYPWVPERDSIHPYPWNPDITSAKYKLWNPENDIGV